MKPLSPAENRLLERLERGLGARLLVGPLIGALGGGVFASVMLAAVGTESRFTLGDQSPAYAQLEAALGATPAFVLLCVAAFGALGVGLAVVIAIRLSSMRARLRMRRDAYAAAAPSARLEA